MHTRTATLETALRASAAWPEAESVGELARSVCSLLLQLISADGAGWNEFDPAGGPLRIVAEPAGYRPLDEELLAALLHENPLVEHLAQLGSGAHAFSDVVGVREFRRRQIYQDVYRPAGVEDQLASTFRSGDGGVIGIALNRGARTFTGDDRRLLGLLASHAAAAHAAIRSREEAARRLDALERGLAAGGRHVVVLAPDGSVAEADEETRLLVGRWFPDGAVEPGRRRRGGAELTVRRAADDPPVFLLEERRTEPDPGRVRAAGLTPRELEVVALAARGLDDRTIAGELVLSTRTVRKHLEHAFRKLGVHNRTAAARRLLDLS